MKIHKNNKGFSLVELIVVVAIMAVLVGVLAPAYLRYVEKTRMQTCYWNMDNVVGEVQLRAFSDPDFMEALTKAANESLSGDGEVLEFIRSTDINVPTCPSRGKYKLIFNQSEGTITMTCDMEVHGLPSEGEIEGGK